MDGQPRRPPHDSAVLDCAGERLAFTTDTFVVSPLFFPGGDIGKLAVFGTVNDLAMAGARPLYLSAGLILEEGLPLETLRRIVPRCRGGATPPACGSSPATPRSSIGARATAFSSTRPAIGLVPAGIEISPAARRARATRCSSAAIWAATGWPIISVREGLAFEGALESDCALAGRPGRGRCCRWARICTASAT